MIKIETVVRSHLVTINRDPKNFASFASIGILITAHVLSIITILDTAAPFFNSN